MLVPIPPEFPLIERVQRVLKPAQRVLSLFQENVKSGEFVRFGEKVWDKAWTKDPFVMAINACARVYEMFKDSDKKN